MKIMVASIFVVCLMISCVAAASPTAASSPSGIQHFLGSWSGEIEHNTLLYNLTKLQMKLNENIAAKIMELKNHQSYLPLLTILSIAFVYGILHALGPGHGKSIISSWIISQHQSLNNVLLISVLAAFFHALSAILIVGGTYVLLGRLVTIGAVKLNNYLEIASAILVICIGLSMLLRPIIGKLTKKSTNPQQLASQPVGGNPLIVAFSIGIVPCPVTSVIFIFSLTLGLVWQGFLLVTSFAIGMGTSLVIVACLVWSLKEKIKNKNLSVIHYAVTNIMPLIGGIFLVLFGSLILLAKIY